MRRRLKPGYESPQGTIDARDLLFQNKNNDGLVGVDYSDQENNTYVIREPEQVHILGSKQDVERFKEFVSTQPAAEVKTSISENIKNVVNKVYPGWIKYADNQVSLVAEFQTAKVAKELFAEIPIEQRINDGNRALDFLNRIRKGENPFTEKTTIEEQIPNLLFNYLSGELAKDGILEEDMYDNILQTTESTDGKQLSLNLPEESDEEAEARNRCKG